MGQCLFWADNGTDLATNTFIQVPLHPVIPGEHIPVDGHQVFVSGFFWSSTTHKCS